MKYFKNVELAKLYGISEGTVRRWIRQTIAGELNLDLYKQGGVTHVSSSSQNQKIIEDLVKKGKKYTNSRWNKVIEPTPEFYETYSDKHIADMITNLQMYREIPLQYSYFGDGADFWDAYVNKKLEAGGDTIFSATIDLIETNFNNILRLTKNYRKVNIVDVGVGNGILAKNLIKSFKEKDLLQKYIAIDISPSILELATSNIKKWFNNEIEIESYIKDITKESFDDIILKNTDPQTINVVLILGGVINNFRDKETALKIVNLSMGKQSILVQTTKPDSLEARNFFDFTIENHGNTQSKTELIIKKLNIDSNLFETFHRFDKTQNARIFGLKPHTDLTINFKFDNHHTPVVLEKDEEITTCRISHESIMELVLDLQKNNFSLLEASTTEDEKFLLTISKVSRQ